MGLRLRGRVSGCRKRPRERPAWGAVRRARYRRKEEARMRQILMTALLIATVVAVYISVSRGDGGTESHIHSSGTVMADGISRISP